MNVIFYAGRVRHHGIELRNPEAYEALLRQRYPDAKVTEAEICTEACGVIQTKHGTVAREGRGCSGQCLL